MIDKKSFENTNNSTTGIDNLGDIGDVQKKKDNVISHTYHNDLREIAKRGGVSISDVLSDEHNWKEQNMGAGKEVSQHIIKKENKIRLFVVIVMFVLGIATIIVGYNVYINKLNTTGIKSSDVLDGGMLFVEQKIVVDVTRQSPSDIKSRLSSMVTSSKAVLGSVVKFIFKSGITDNNSGVTSEVVITQKDIIKLFGLSFSDRFVRFLNSSATDNYMIGIHISKENTPFIILTVDSFEIGIAGMLDWEKRAVADLSPFFYMGTDIYSKASEFKNDVINNINVRILYGNNMKIRFIYGFIDKNTILMTNDRFSFRELSKRFLVKKARTPASLQPDIADE